MNTEKETFVTKTGKTIEIDPALLIDTIDIVNEMVNAHVALLKTVKDIIAMYTKNGFDLDTCGEIALELQRRAADKANTLVTMEDGKNEEKTETYPDNKTRRNT